MKFKNKKSQDTVFVGLDKKYLLHLWFVAILARLRPAEVASPNVPRRCCDLLCGSQLPPPPGGGHDLA